MSSRNPCGGAITGRGPHMTRYVVYTRIGYDDRGQPHATLAAQERSIRFFLEEYAEPDARVIGTFCDRHVLKGSDDQLQQALSMCRDQPAELLIARLDRLPFANTGYAAFFADPHLKLRVATLPGATRTELSIHARLLAQERSIHTRLAMLKPDRHAPSHALRPEAPEVRATDQVVQIALPMRQRGASLRDIANVLNRAGLVTTSGTAWRPAQVSRILQLVQ